MNEGVKDYQPKKQGEGAYIKKTPKCKHIPKYKTSFGQWYCPVCDRNVKEE